MALPTYYPFKTKYIAATSPTSNTYGAAAVPARAKLLTVYLTPAKTDQTATGAWDVTVNGSTATGMGAIAASTGVAGVITYNASPTAVTYLAAGDVLATVSSSIVATNSIFVVQEF